MFDGVRKHSKVFESVRNRSKTFKQRFNALVAFPNIDGRSKYDILLIEI